MGSAAANSEGFMGARPVPLASSGQARSTVIGSEAAIRGDVRSAGEIVVAGKVNGEVSSESKIVIATGGTVEGTLNAPEIVIDGNLVGDATATKVLSIGDKGEVRGDLTTPSIIITSGATFVGRCSMPEAA